LGTARIFGRDCWRQTRRVKADVGYLPGDLRLYSWLTGAAALRLFGQIRGTDLLRDGRELAEEFDLDLGVRVRAMSRGMRQKLGLILALAPRPRLLILDEPTASLDPIMQERLRARLRRLATAGHTVFFSSHTLSEVEELCDHVAIVRDGRLVASESLEALRRRAGYEVAIRFGPGAALPDPPAGFRLHERTGQHWSGRVEGPIGDFVQWLAGRPVEDVTITRPDLETLFRRFYQPGGDTPPPARPETPR
jgi:ABC-2 type transport system ATP-binding protein